MKEENVKVIYRPFDCDFKGALLLRFDDGEDYYTIVINSNLSEDEQYITLRHEIAHITNRDFESSLPIDEIERIRENVWKEKWKWKRSYYQFLW